MPTTAPAGAGACSSQARTRPPSVTGGEFVSGCTRTLPACRSCEWRIYFEYMPTTVHIPKELLHAVDRRARALKVSRNRFIVRTLEQEVTARNEWTPGFFDTVRRLGRKHTKAVEIGRASCRERVYACV